MPPTWIKGSSLCQTALIAVIFSYCVFIGCCLGSEQTALDTRKGALENVSQVISDLLDGYDIRLRPQFGGEYVVMV